MKRSTSLTSDDADVRRLEVVRWPGLVPYADGVARQEERLAARIAGTVPDALFMLQHAPVFTLGRRAPREHILGSAELLAARGIDVFETGRGGDVTYHGPGQLVGYPIIDLKPDRKDVRRYVHDLEQVMIDTCAAFGIASHRVDGLIGCWIEGQRKIGAVGVRITKWCTMHGFALNVSEDVQPAFQMIVPCGISDRGVTSLQRELGRSPPFEEVADIVEERFRALFGGRPKDPAEKGPSTDVGRKEQ